MAGRRRNGGSSTVSLAANPDYDEDEDDYDGYDDDQEPETVSKSRRGGDAYVRKSLAQIAKGQVEMAAAMGYIAKAMQSSITKHDPNAAMPPPQGGAPAPGGAAPPPPGGQQPPMPPPDAQMQGDDRLDLAGGGYGKLGGAPHNAKLQKDDSSSNFGEIDADEPGNHPWDQKKIGDDDTLITGKPGSGPGPMSGALRKAITDEVISTLQKSGVIPSTPGSTISKSASTPMPGIGGNQYAGQNSQLSKMDEDPAFAVGTMVKLGFQQINRARSELAPESWPTPIAFGYPFGSVR